MNIKKTINSYALYSPEYGGGLTNHLPMVQFALYRMGASKSRIIKYSNEYLLEKGIKKAEKSDVNINSIEDELCVEKSYLNYVDYYKNKADFEGIDPIIAGVLNKLYGGLSSALFHGIIRVSYSLQSQNEDEIYRALAYYSSVYEAVPFTRRKIDIAILNDEIQNILTHKSSDYFYLKGEIALLESLVELYIRSGSFVVLHCITGYHALMNLKEYYDDFNEVFDRFTVCVQKTLLRVTLDSFKKVSITRKHESWEEILNIACSVNHSHTIKFIYSCFELSKQFNISQLIDIVNIKLIIDHNL